MFEKKLLKREIKPTFARDPTARLGWDQEGGWRSEASAQGAPL